MSLANKLAEERRGRLAAERMLELKQAELFAANRKLGLHARALSEEIVETRAEVAIVRDENLRVKSELTTAHQKIEQVERRMWHTIETINDGFAFYSSDLELIMANRSFLSVFDGLEIIRPGVNYVTMLQMMTDEGIVNTGDLPPDEWRRMMTERIQEPAPDPVTVRLWDGGYIKLIDQRGPDGDIVSLGLNITAAVRYEAQLREARQVAESANRAKSAFLANMSHEIRTPMNGVVGMAEVLAETDLTADQRLCVDTIKHSGEALLVIINDVLDYSKIEADKLELLHNPFDLERLIHEVMVLLEPAASEKGLEIALDYDMELPGRFLGDPGRLRQVMTNLVGNAIKFTASGGIVVRVRGIASEGSASLIVEIEDSGIGIPADKIDHIFGEFNQVENARNRKFDGTGLGLAISKRLVTKMGGELWVKSTEGEGTCFGFDIDLPLSGDGASPERDRPDGVARVHVVDASATARDILQRQLRALGFEVTGGPTFDAAADDADLVIADRMPEFTGDGFAPALLRLTARSTLATAGEVGDVLTRPYLREDLVARVGIAAGCRGSEVNDAPVPVFSHRAAPRPAQATPPPDESGSRLRVLTAEDNRTNRLVFGKMVQDLDIDLRFAANGEEAVKLYRDFQPDLIFMDISMPKMDGKEATRRIRADEAGTGRHVPIVALTAHAMRGDDAAILAAGLDHYMTKPLRKAELVERIRAAAPAPLGSSGVQAAE
ncbi:ATP-binding protein [Sulfitobacter sp. D35]|uniref:ATP-binding protein n=1 Tax=Sulfitobacter sp. D35 TaxID=3083252 RepID=UPI00296E2A0B|nr:ATP-binding protein [Sulfitobacter sp. D35]MDW4498272.1 ATP-binding protein [Sulfitobacter sp. D35]